MADDLFEDSTMTFGEHIEELRIHLLRAIYGVLLVGVVMAFFGSDVVKIITEPVVSEWEPWMRNRLETRKNEWVAEQKALPPDEQLSTHLHVTLESEQLKSLAMSLNPDGAVPDNPPPVTLALKTKLYDLVDTLNMPLAEISRRWHMRVLATQEAVMVWFKCVLGASIVVSSPWVFFQIYSFIAVGLYAHERRFVHMSLPFSVLLFLLGVLFCYFVMFPFMMRFFLQTNEWMDLEPEFRLTEWVGFAVLLTVIFGVTFQMPLFMLTLERVGLVTHDQLAGKRKYAVLFNFVFAAIVTPQDPTTQVLLAIPMCLLFEFGLVLMRYFQRSNPFAVSDPEFNEF